MAEIAHIANLWSLQQHPFEQREWSLEKKIEAVAAVGGGGYNITGLPPTWPDAATLRGKIAHLWRT